jgi:hypothetical protein
MAAIVAVVAVGGIGFASFTATAYLNGSAQAGTIQLQWGADPVATPSATYVTCSAVVGETTTAGDTLTVSASNLAPGDSCSFADSLNDVGSLPGTTYAQLQAPTFAGGDSSWFATDTYGTHSYPPVESPLGPISIAPGAPIAYTLTWGLNSGDASNQGASVSFTILFTATAGS